MSFDDWSVVERFQLAVQSLAGRGTLQERLERALLQFEPLSMQNVPPYPPEVAEEFRPIHEGLKRGVKAEEVTDDQAVEVARIIVGVSHRLRALYAETKVRRETHSSPSPAAEAPSREGAGETMSTPEARGEDEKHKWKVFLRLRRHGTREWTNETYTFARIPALGEYIATDPRSLYKVQYVVHLPFSRDLDAEVSAVAVDPIEAEKKAMPDYPWE